MAKSLVILGAESLGREAAEIALASGYSAVTFLDDSVNLRGGQVLNLPVLGGFDAARLFVKPDTAFFVAVGTAGVRERWIRTLRDAGAHLATLVHPRAEVSPSARVGANTMVSYGCHLASNVLVGEGNVFWSSVTVSHDCTVGNHCFFGPAVAMGGYTHIGNYSMFGCGAKLRSCITIGDRVVVGMGAIVVRPVPDDHFAEARADPVPIEGRSAEDIYFGRVRTLPRRTG